MASPFTNPGPQRPPPSPGINIAGADKMSAHRPAPVERTPSMRQEAEFENPAPDLYRTFSPTEVAFWAFDKKNRGGGGAGGAAGGGAFWDTINSFFTSGASKK